MTRGGGQAESARSSLRSGPAPPKPDRPVLMRRRTAEPRRPGRPNSAPASAEQPSAPSPASKRLNQRSRVSGGQHSQQVVAPRPCGHAMDAVEQLLVLNAFLAQRVLNKGGMARRRPEQPGRAAQAAASLQHSDAGRVFFFGFCCVFCFLFVFFCGGEGSHTFFRLHVHWLTPWKLSLRDVPGHWRTYPDMRRCC